MRRASIPSAPPSPIPVETCSTLICVLIDEVIRSLVACFVQQLSREVLHADRGEFPARSARENRLASPPAARPTQVDEGLPHSSPQDHRPEHIHHSYQ